MSIKDQIQNAMKQAMKDRDKPRLECLRMAKGALLVVEKSSAEDLTDDAAIAALRAEVRKRVQSIELFEEIGKDEEAQATRAEIVILEEFMPKQLSEEDLETKVVAYLREHPEIDHAGKLTGAVKKELGDLADGKLLNAVCRKVLEK